MEKRQSNLVKYTGPGAILPTSAKVPVIRVLEKTKTLVGSVFIDARCI